MERLRDVDKLDDLMNIFASSESASFEFRDILAYGLLEAHKVDGVLTSSQSALKFAKHGKWKHTLQQQRFVKKLVFDGIALGDLGIINIMSHLMKMHPTSSVESLSFVGCSINKGGMLAIAQFMQDSESHKVRSLNLSNNPLGGTGALGILRTVLCQPSAVHWSLNLANIGLNSVTDRDDITTIVSESSGVIKLNLSNNAIDNTMFLDIISLLKGNTLLAELDLTGNDMISMEMLQTVIINLQNNITITGLQLPNICNADGILIETLPLTSNEVFCMQYAQEEIGRIIHRNLAYALTSMLGKGSSAVEYIGSEPELLAEGEFESLTRAVLDTAVAPVMLSATDDDKASAVVTRRRATTDAKELLRPSDSLDDATAEDGVVLCEEPSSALANCWHAVVERCCPRRRISTR